LQTNQEIRSVLAGLDGTALAVSKGMARLFSFITVLLLLLTLVPRNALCDQKIDRVTFPELEQLMHQLSRGREYETRMQVMRLAMREKLLGHIWRKTQVDPDFRMGALRFRELFEKLETFKVFENDTNLALQADSERRSDFYVLNGGWGAINKNTFEEANGRGLMLLPLHVFLGAVGYQDENYQLTLLLALYNESLSPHPVKTPPVQLLERVDWKRLFPATEAELYRTSPQPVSPSAASSQQKDERLLFAGGGFTGVGGGGDVLSLIVKLELIDGYFKNGPGTVLSEFCFLRWSDPTFFLDDVFKSEIESDPRVQMIELDKPSEGKGRILIPRFKAEDQDKLKQTTGLARICLCALQERRK
jgi:hypothetical protein